MKIYSENRKAGFDYEILEKYEAGLVLLGHEVKSIKGGHMSLNSCYIVFKQNEPFLTGSKVAPYQPNNTPEDYNSSRDRKLLLSKKEIDYRQ